MLLVLPFNKITRVHMQYFDVNNSFKNYVNMVF